MNTTQERTYTSGKTDVSTQSFAQTPNGELQVWLFKRLGEEEAHAQDNTQSIRDARKKARLEKETGKSDLQLYPFRRRRESTIRWARGDVRGGQHLLM